MYILNPTTEEKLRDYEDTLAFIQSELKADREKLEQAKKSNAAEEVIELIEQDITKLELGVDRYQTWIQVLRKNIADHES